MTCPTCSGKLTHGIQFSHGADDRHVMECKACGYYAKAPTQKEALAEIENQHARKQTKQLDLTQELH